jgi:hypothetical protein
MCCIKYSAANKMGLFRNFNIFKSHLARAEATRELRIAECGVPNAEKTEDGR